jgi:molybdopterin molybdotransferase
MTTKAEPAPTPAEPPPTAAAPGLLSVEAALDAVLAEVAPVDTERVKVSVALGRVVAQPVTARVSLPPWANSAMDGYAIRAVDTTRATDAEPVTLRVIGDIAAGAAPGVAIGPGTAARIATGARLPDGADAVVPVESTTPVDVDGRPGSRGRDSTGPLPAACLVHQVVPIGGSVRDAGSDLLAGATLFVAGAALTAAAVGLAAGAGVDDLIVHRRPRVGVLATGDEIRAPGQPLGPAGIPDANGPGLRSQVTAAGAEAIDLGIASDDLADVLKRLRGGLEVEADALIISGGVSVGPYDVVKTAMETLGRVDLWRVAVQPGKPFAFGVAPRPGGGAPILVFGLPGNPVSSAVTFELFVRPAIRRLAGRTELLRPADRAVLEGPVSKSHGRRAFLRVVADRADDGAPLRDDRGRVRVRLAGGQGSHVLSALAAADALAIIPETDDSLPAGADVALWWLDTA